MERPDQETKLFLRDGQPGLRRLHPRRPAPRARCSCATARVGQDVLDRGARAPAARGPRLGQPPGRDRAAHRGRAGSFLKVQVSEVIFDTFGWARRARSPSRARPAARHRGHPGDGPRRTCSWRASGASTSAPRLAELFPDLTMAVEARVNPERVKHSVTLTPEEWNVSSSCVDGRRSLGEICRLAGDARRAGHPADPAPPGARAVRDRGAAAAARQRRPTRRCPSRSPSPDGHRAQVVVDAPPCACPVEFRSGMRSVKLERRHQRDRDPQGRRLPGERRQGHGQPAGAGGGRRARPRSRSAATPTRWAATATTTS